MTAFMNPPVPHALRRLVVTWLLLVSTLLAWPTWAAAPFTDNNNGTVTDSGTSLVWDQCPYGLTGASCTTGTALVTDWAGALNAVVAANAAKYKGSNDWRLPNKNELESIVKLDSTSPAIDTAAFPATPSNWFWTSTTYARIPSDAWVVNFVNGDAGAYGKADAYYARLVRSGQSLASFDLFPTAFTIGGSVTGLTGSVVLQNNAGNDLTVNANGSFTFSSAINSGTAYAVSVRTQPTGQTCTVSGGTGTASANVTNVAVSCATNTYTIGGSVSGLTGSMVLQNNAGNDLTLSANGSFTFTSAINSGAAYAVTIKTQPTGQTCTVSNASGTASANVSNVAVSCGNNPVTASYTAASPTTPGSSITTTISGGGLGCGFATAQYQTVASPPPGMTLPHGVVGFTTTNCGAGATVDMSITYPQNLPKGAKFYKFGPELGNTAPHWFELAGASINGATVSYSITDNSTGDSNSAAGVITDPAGYAVAAVLGGVTSVPTLSEWAMILLASLMAAVGMAGVRRRG